MKKNIVFLFVFMLLILSSCSSNEPFTKTGRLYSRKSAKEHFTMADFTKSMERIFSTSIQESALDESPMAYKSMDDIVNNHTYC